ncbi:MAG: hypothetical protein M1830_006020, partial [Pleopsidium flavum]
RLMRTAAHSEIGPKGPNLVSEQRDSMYEISILRDGGGRRGLGESGRRGLGGSGRRGLGGSGKGGWGGGGRGRLTVTRPPPFYRKCEHMGHGVGDKAS